MNFRKLARLIVFIIGLGTSLVMAQGVNFDASQLASTIKLTDGGMFTVSLTREPWQEGVYKAPQLWGAWGATPESVIAHIEVKRNKKAMYIPFSSYADLANPRGVVLRTKGKNVQLEITGGNGGDSYRAVLVFANGKFLSSRQIMSSVMPRDAREETRYSVLQE